MRNCILSGGRGIEVPYMRRLIMKSSSSTNLIGPISCSSKKGVRSRQSVIFVLSNRFLKTFAISAKPKKSLTHQTSSKHFLKDANLRPFKECRHSSGMFNHFNACPSRAEDRTKSTNFHAIILVDFVGENVNHDYGAITGVDSVKRPA